MQYSPKLKKAMEQIKAIISENDIAALVVLHEPGFGEVVVKIDPSYSCASIENGNIRIKGKLQEHFGGDREAWEKSLGDTSNMFKVLTDISGPLVVGLMDVSNTIDKLANSEHIDGGRTSHDQQNN